MKRKMIFLFVITTLFFFTSTIYSLAMATIHVKATDNDGWANTRYYLYKYNPSEKEYQQQSDYVYCEKGEHTYSVKPGIYKIIANYRETYVTYSKAIENIQIGDNQKIDKEIYFEKGFIHVKATDNDGWANTRYYLYKYNPSEKEYQQQSDYVYCEKGEHTYSVKPGIYKIIANYREKEPSLKIETDDINMVDKITQFIPIDFGTEGLNLSKVRVKGLLEIGDYDGIFELGEKVSVDFEVSSGNMEKILVYLNDEKLKEYNQPGQYYIEFTVNKVGDNNLKISLKNNKIDIPIEIPLKFIVNPQDGKSGKIEHIEKSRTEEKEEEKEKVILPENDTLIYHAEKEATATKIEMYVKGTPDNKTLFKIILTASVPSPLAQNNFMGNGWISLILPESTYVDYSSIKIYGTSNIGSNDYVQYQPMAKTLIEKLELFKYVISKIPIVGLISDVSKIRPSAEHSSTQAIIDLNNYDVVNLDWQIPLFNYWRQIKIEIPVEITHQIEVGLYAYWQSKAVSSDGSGPTFVRDNIVEPGMNINISELFD